MRLLLPVLVCLLAACEPMQWPGDLRLPDGAVYEGELQDQLFHGQGSLSWPDGRHYQGEFRRGRITGQGKLVDRQGCVHQGRFRNGVLHGQGFFTCDDAVYQGRFVDGELTRGTVTYPDGHSYQGEFRDFAPHGQGLWITDDGDQYRGRFENGAIVEGEYSGNGGYHYQGQFRYFTFQGRGSLTRPDGMVVHARFEHGQAQGVGRRERQGDDGEPVVEPGYFVNGDYFASEAAYRQRKHQQAADMEARLYTESSRLQSVLASLAPQRPGVRDVYLLLVGGDGNEGVFSREVSWVSKRLGGEFSLKHRQVQLVNGGGQTLPLATRTSIRESLNALDALMAPNEDLLMVHLASHGTRQGALLLDAPGLKLNNLTVDDAKQWLNRLAVAHQWLVVSACYSGHWVKQLASPDRVVFSSAAKNRTSFGCDTESQRTWFSQALYGKALEQVGPERPAAWFAAARKAVTAEEKAQGIVDKQHSLPQHSIGTGFAKWWGEGMDNRQ